ncbi:MAG: hypothetical protein ABIL70_01710 [candidate division WOR-3 bacterium]
MKKLSVKEYQREYRRGKLYKQQREAWLIKNPNYYKDWKVAHLDYFKKWAVEHPDYFKIYRHKHRKKLNEYWRKYRRKERAKRKLCS